MLLKYRTGKNALKENGSDLSGARHTTVRVTGQNGNTIDNVIEYRRVE